MWGLLWQCHPAPGSRRPRVRCALLAAILVGLCLLAGATPAAAGSSATPYPASAAITCRDGDDGLKFDGQSTSDDAAVGIPGEDVGSAKDAGRVEVRYVCGSRRAPQSLTLPTPHAGDEMGSSSAGTWINGDRYQDLVVGVPGLDVGAARDAGGVAVFLGSATGLRYSRTLTQASPGVPGTVQAGARFGAAVSSQAFAHSVEPESDAIVRIGEPGRNVGAAIAAGGFVDLAYNPKGLDPKRTFEVTLNSPGVPGTAGSGDRLGSAFWLDRSVGAPGMTVSGHPRAGGVLRTYFSGDRLVANLVTQDTPGMPGTAETGDGFGSAVAGAWIGVPGESIGAAAGAGMVERWGGGPDSWFALTQDSPGVAGAVAAGYHFGAALAEASHLIDDTEYGPDRLFIGVPGEDVGSRADVGTVDVMNESDDPEDQAKILGGLGTLSPSSPQASARFGSSLARAEFLEVRVGSPGSRGGAGRADSYSCPAGILSPPRCQLETAWTQATGTSES